MKKLLISLFVISAVLLSAIYLVGERTENEIQKMFAKSEQHGLSTELLSYDKQFLKATLISQVTWIFEEEKPVVFTVTSAIQHYPHKAVINNQIHLLDPELAKKVQGYFASENWISSREEISLSGQLTGQLQLLPGRYNNEDELFATKALQLDYQADLQDYSGSLNLNWQGLDVQTSDDNFSVETVKLRSDFAALPIGNEYDYFVDITRAVIRQKNTQIQLQGIELLGNSRPGGQADTIDSSNEWKVAAYQIDNGSEKVFTDNSFKLELKGQSSPALTRLSNASDEQQVGKALAELMAHGAQFTLTELTSQTPWGKVNGALDIILQPGARLSEIVENPFMLLDYTSGNANLLLPEALLQLPRLSQLLQTALQSGLLKRQDKTLSLEMQLEQGELTVNGRVIPL